MKFLRSAAEWVIPPRCLKCLAVTGRQGILCGDCWKTLTFLAHPLCACCGLPFELEALEGTLCGACLVEPPPFRRARSVVRYDGESRELVLRFKHGDALHMARPFAQWMHRAASDLLADADMLIPVPLHWTRVWRRRYNQAALLAQELAFLTGLTYEPFALARTRRTASQGRKTIGDRQRNVQGAFSILPKYAKVLEGRSVVLVDDVMASGATIQECARALKKNGAQQIDVLTFARSVK